MKNSDLPAMPCSEGSVYNVIKGINSEAAAASLGVTKREYFASLTLQGYCANPRMLEAMTHCAELHGISEGAFLAKASLEAADALIEALEK